MKPDDPSARVSQETIYAAIYAQLRGGLKVAVIDELLPAKPARGRRRTTLASNSMTPDPYREIFFTE